MRKEHRTEERFLECGRVEINALCILPGVLDDISITGCKVRFSVPVQVDMEGEYTLRLYLDNMSMELLARPQWHTESRGGSGIGFYFLRSKDTPLLTEFIHARKFENVSFAYHEHSSGNARKVVF